MTHERIAHEKELDIATHWIYDRIINGTSQIAEDNTTYLYLLADKPATLEEFSYVKAKMTI